MAISEEVQVRKSERGTLPAEDRIQFAAERQLRVRIRSSLSMLNLTIHNIFQYLSNSRTLDLEMPSEPQGSRGRLMVALGRMRTTVGVMPPRLFLKRRVVALLAVAVVSACSGRKQEPQPAATPPPATSGAEAPIAETASPYDALPKAVREMIGRPFTLDFDELVARRMIRVAVSFNRTHYFIDKGQERGLTYESLKLFENDLNSDLKTGNLKVNVVIVPLTRDQLYPALAGGKVVMVAAMVTVRPEAEKLVAFSEPTRTNVSEVVVTGPSAPPIATVDDLAGQEVFVRKGSIYHESLIHLNGKLRARGKAALVITFAPDVLEDDDVLEMVNAGLVKTTIVDDYLAGFWGKVFTNLKVYQDVSVRSGGNLAVAFRKENPKLREVVNVWIRKHSKGEAFRNTIEQRYLQNVKYAKNAAADTERQKFQAVASCSRSTVRSTTLITC